MTLSYGDWLTYREFCLTRLCAFHRSPLIICQRHKPTYKYGGYDSSGVTVVRWRSVMNKFGSFEGTRMQICHVVKQNINILTGGSRSAVVHERWHFALAFCRVRILEDLIFLIGIQ